MESLKCQAEDFGSYPMAIETLSPAPILLSAHKPSEWRSQVERLLSFTVFVVSFPFVEDLSLGSVVNGTGLEAGQVGQNPEPLGLPKSG